MAFFARKISLLPISVNPGRLDGSTRVPDTLLIVLLTLPVSPFTHHSPGFIPAQGPAQATYAYAPSFSSIFLDLSNWNISISIRGTLGTKENLSLPRTQISAFYLSFGSPRDHFGTFNTGPLSTPNPPGGMHLSWMFRRKFIMSFFWLLFLSFLGISLLSPLSHGPCSILHLQIYSRICLIINCGGLGAMLMELGLKLVRSDIGVCTNVTKLIRRLGSLGYTLIMRRRIEIELSNWKFGIRCTTY